MPASKLLAFMLVLTIAGAGVIVDAAAAPLLAVKPQKITPGGVGQVRLGETYAKLRARHLVGKITPGCPLAGPDARAATLRLPLKGGVDFTLSLPRKVAAISIRGGARARGVGIGATIAQIRAAFPKARVDHSTDHTFAITLVRIPKGAGGRLQFGVDVNTHKTILIGIPAIPFCE